MSRKISPASGLSSHSFMRSSIERSRDTWQRSRTCVGKEVGEGNICVFFFFFCFLLLLRSLFIFYCSFSLFLLFFFFSSSFYCVFSFSSFSFSVSFFFLLRNTYLPVTENGQNLLIGQDGVFVVELRRFSESNNELLENEEKRE